MKATIAIGVQPEDLAKLEAQTGDQSNPVSRGTLIEKGLEQVTSDPKALATLVTSLASAPEEPAQDAPLKRTSIMVAPGIVEATDRLAARLVTTRNSIVQMVVKGLLSGVIRP